MRNADVSHEVAAILFCEPATTCVPPRYEKATDSGGGASICLDSGYPKVTVLDATVVDALFCHSDRTSLVSEDKNTL